MFWIKPSLKDGTRRVLCNETTRFGWK